MVLEAASGFRLLLPAVIPSWRFFDVIAPSPRIEYVHGRKTLDMAHWREFRPRPAEVSPQRMLLRLFWNPEWNESLYLVSCAERLLEHPTEHSGEEIFKRIRADLLRSTEPGASDDLIQFRLVLVCRGKDAIEREVVHVSEVMPLFDERAP